jgi:S-adenosylmethionine/arginine decarboxylase-like enzyme
LIHEVEEEGREMNGAARSPYGRELILDLHECEVGMFTREHIERYFVDLCELIDMKREYLFWWDDVGLPEDKCQTEPHLKGTSAVQFILTSNVTVHALDLLGNLYVNIFSCKEFDSNEATAFTMAFFGGCLVNRQEIARQ